MVQVRTPDTSMIHLILDTIHCMAPPGGSRVLTLAVLAILSALQEEQRDGNKQQAARPERPGADEGQQEPAPEHQRQSGAPCGPRANERHPDDGQRGKSGDDDVTHVPSRSIFEYPNRSVPMRLFRVTLAILLLGVTTALVTFWIMDPERRSLRTTLATPHRASSSGSTTA